jgi:hypothetical protein
VVNWRVEKVCGRARASGLRRVLRGVALERARPRWGAIRGCSIVLWESEMS